MTTRIEEPSHVSSRSRRCSARFNPLKYKPIKPNKGSAPKAKIAALRTAWNFDLTLIRFLMDEKSVTAMRRSESVVIREQLAMNDSESCADFAETRQKDKTKCNLAV